MIPNSKNNLKISIHFKSFYFKNLTKFLNKITSKIQTLNLNSTNTVYLPIKRQRFVVLRSPHIDKKAREHFEIRSYHRLLVLNCNLLNEGDLYKIKLLLNYIFNLKIIHSGI
jgi:ribosomal protein S10